MAEKEPSSSPPPTSPTSAAKLQEDAERTAQAEKEVAEKLEALKKKNPFLGFDLSVFTEQDRELCKKVLHKHQTYPLWFDGTERHQIQLFRSQDQIFFTRMHGCTVYSYSHGAEIHNIHVVVVLW
jgi:hypothetical protein